MHELLYVLCKPYKLQLATGERRLPPSKKHTTTTTKRRRREREKEEEEKKSSTQVSMNYFLRGHDWKYISDLR